ncbi:hypothetical protein TBR22_A42810 [Luteitalea sp. TBR-22]|uniref:hypothetical protein n=1 Tax=Luteitalea sp. TBR-22 TaxID=2802971 RepID=UPI001AFA1F1C|nr:hypothetical protein [Luteitalea sp. TBR-22]BCS35055.1 hypothetical protein TBR22_A42810 [Luteitalea sp. TBR-22]
MTRRDLACSIATAVVALTVCAGAQAQPSDRQTFLTFSGPVEVPGRVLPAGKYEFRLVDDESSRDIVQIRSGNRVIGTYLTVPTDTLKTPDKSFVTFEKPVAGSPLAIRAWFYPGDTVGQEFVYPKRHAVAIAKAAQQPVKVTTDAMAPHMSAEEPAAQQQAVAALKAAPIQVARPQGDDVEIVEMALVELPRTASTLPLRLLVGIALMGLGFVVVGQRRVTIGA